jgi:NAD(P)-dependent dehydrogenase (short-subunit alcohol dehydrogenase family)
MARQGAKHLVLLSRSGPRAASAKRLLSDLRQKSVQVYAPQCDVSLEEDVTEAIEHVKRNMPPIRGCIHGALVVKVSTRSTLH